MANKALKLGSVTVPNVSAKKIAKAVAPDKAIAATETPAQSSTVKKRGRRAATTAPDEMNVTVKLSQALIDRLRIIAIQEHTTLKEIFDTALRNYLNK